jgi:hypothetical protein
VPMKIVSDRGT